jgi:hypothetical protein
MATRVRITITSDSEKEKTASGDFGTHGTVFFFSTRRVQHLSKASHPNF